MTMFDSVKSLLAQPKTRPARLVGAIWQTHHDVDWLLHSCAR
jgi:hypothetical protein